MRIVSTGPLFPPANELLRDVIVADDDEQLRELLGEADALIVRSGISVTRATLDAAPRLRVIGRTGVGFSEIDVSAATERGIPIVITPDAGAQAVAEGALALMLALGKRLPELDRAVREGRWRFRDEVELGDFEGATLGIVGYGKIGRRLAALARPFGMRVIAHDPYAADADVELVALKRLFGESNFVSLHAPLTAETRGLVYAGVLALARGAILVNLGRGALVRSLDDLLAALESGALTGVGLDVFDPEPPDPAHPLFRYPNVLLSPHALGMTPLARERIYREMSEGVLAVLRGERPRAVANPGVFS
jgi:phosphoglycerate dehydrogenase-like enzyme